MRRTYPAKQEQERRTDNNKIYFFINLEKSNAFFLHFPPAAAAAAPADRLAFLRGAPVDAAPEDGWVCEFSLEVASVDADFLGVLHALVRVSNETGCWSSCSEPRICL